MSRMSKASGRRPRRRFSEEFKEGAVRLVFDEGKTVGAVARELDLTASALGLWVQHARAEWTKGKSGPMKEEREELTRLRIENRELRMERDILKKASALFAKHPSVDTSKPAICGQSKPAISGGQPRLVSSTSSRPPAASRCGFSPA